MRCSLYNLFVFLFSAKRSFLLAYLSVFHEAVWSVCLSALFSAKRSLLFAYLYFYCLPRSGSSFRLPPPQEEGGDEKMGYLMRVTNETSQEGISQSLSSFAPCEPLYSFRQWPYRGRMGSPTERFVKNTAFCRELRIKSFWIDKGWVVQKYQFDRSKSDYNRLTF